MLADFLGHCIRRFSSAPTVSFLMSFRTSEVLTWLLPAGILAAYLQRPHGSQVASMSCAFRRKFWCFTLQSLLIWGFLFFFFLFLGWLLNRMIHWHRVNSIIDDRISACAPFDFKVIFYVSSKHWWRGFDRFLILLALFLFSSFWFQVSFLDVWFAVLNAEAVKELYDKMLESVNVKRSMPPNAWLWSMIEKCGSHGDIELLFDILKNLRRFVSFYSFFICIVRFYLN